MEAAQDNNELAELFDVEEGMEEEERQPPTGEEEQPATPILAPPTPQVLAPPAFQVPAPPGPGEQETEVEQARRLARRRGREEFEAATPAEEEAAAAARTQRVVAALPVEVRTALTSDDLRRLLGSAQAFQLARDTETVESLRAQLEGAQDRMIELETEVGQLQQQLTEALYAPVQTDPRVIARMQQEFEEARAAALAEVAVIEQRAQSMETLENQVNVLREQLAASARELLEAQEAARVAEAQAREAEERARAAEAAREALRQEAIQMQAQFAGRLGQLSNALAGVASPEGTFLSRTYSALSWVAFGYMALAGMRDDAVQAVARGVTPDQPPLPPPFWQAGNLTRDAYVRQMAREASEYVSIFIEPPIRARRDQALAIRAQLGNRPAGPPSDVITYERLAAEMDTIANTAQRELDAVGAAATPERFAADYAGMMANSFLFLRAASLLAQGPERERDLALDVLPQAIREDRGPRTLPYLMAAALWFFSENPVSLTVPSNPMNIMQAWVMAHIMRSFWWPIALIVADARQGGDPTPLDVLWSEISTTGRPYDGNVLDDQFYYDLERAFADQFADPTLEFLLRVMSATVGSRYDDAEAMAERLCGLISEGSAGLLSLSLGLLDACREQPPRPDAVIDGLRALARIGRPPWNSVTVNPERALLRSRSGPGAPLAKITRL
jgi:hypothetical protein